jgi:hypothetical protein
MLLLLLPTATTMVWEMRASAATAACHRRCCCPPCAAAAAPAPASQVKCASGKRVPPFHTSNTVLLGAALRNTCVQPLLDAVVDFLPPPSHSSPASPSLPPPESSTPPETVAFAFKTVFDVKMGQELTYVRVYSGTLTPRQALHVSGSGGASIERVASIFRILADEVQPLQQVHLPPPKHASFALKPFPLAAARW